MKNRILAGFILMVSLCVTGCIGGKSVESSYLRIGINSAKNNACEKVEPGLPKLAVKRYTCLPALDRETVIVANGPVLKPDYRWSWEGTPAEVFDLVSGQVLNCMESHEVVPYRPVIERSAIMSGVITSFEVHRDTSDYFKVGIRYSLWNESGKVLIARKYLEATAPLKSISGYSIALAAQEAIDSVMDKTVRWIDGIGSDAVPNTGK